HLFRAAARGHRAPHLGDIAKPCGPRENVLDTKTKAPEFLGHLRAADGVKLSLSHRSTLLAGRWARRDRSYPTRMVSFGEYARRHQVKPEAFRPTGTGSTVARSRLRSPPRTVHTVTRTGAHGRSIVFLGD